MEDAGKEEKIRKKFLIYSMDRSSEVEDYNDDEEVEDYSDDEEMVMEDELKMKFMFNVSPLEIIYKEDFIVNAAAAAATPVDNKNICNQIDLVIHVIDHQFIYQYWSLKSGDPQLSVSSSCHHQYHRHFHHLHDDDDDNDKEVIMITCQPAYPPVVDELHIDIGGVFASHDHQNHVVLNKEDEEDDYIMSLLNDVNIFHEREQLTYEEFKEVKKCITQRISEAKPAVLMAKPKRVRILVDISTIVKRYYTNSAVANSAAAQIAIELSECAEVNHHYRPQTDETRRPASMLSRDTLETKIFDEKDLISSSSSSSCPVCLNEFRVGVDKVQKMPCSHVFHRTCLREWLEKRNTCPFCRHELPVYFRRGALPQRLHRFEFWLSQ